MMVDVHFFSEKFAPMEQNCYLCIVVNNKSSLIYEVFRIRGRIKGRRMLGHSERR